jgi:hypothetical protein
VLSVSQEIECRSPAVFQTVESSSRASIRLGHYELLVNTDRNVDARFDWDPELLEAEQL